MVNKVCVIFNVKVYIIKCDMYPDSAFVVRYMNESHGRGPANDAEHRWESVWGWYG